MHFENCPSHPTQPINLILDPSSRADILCQQCYDQSPRTQPQSTVLLNQSSLQYFFLWNNYLITEMTSIQDRVSNQGFHFLFINTNNESESHQGHTVSPFGAPYPDPQQILISVIHKHLNLLYQNMAFVAQASCMKDLANPMFLNDMYNMVLRKMEDILEPIRFEFSLILHRQNYDSCNLEWRKDIIDWLEVQRQSIINSLGRQNFIKITSASTNGLPQEDRMKEDLDERLQTQDSLNKSQCDSLDLTDDNLTEMPLLNISKRQKKMAQIELMEDSAIFQSSTSKSILKSTSNTFTNFGPIQQQQLQTLKLENEWLKRVIQQKEKETNDLNNKLAESQRQNDEWMLQYRVLEDKFGLIIDEKIPFITQQVDSLNAQIQSLLELGESQDAFIAQIKKTVTLHIGTIEELRKSMAYFQAQIQELEQANETLREENQRLNGFKAPSYYLNPVYEKNKIDQKLIEQVVELEASKMQLEHDLKILLECLKTTKAQLIQINSHIPVDQSLDESQQNNGLGNWQNLMLQELKQLYTQKIRSI